MDYFDPEAVQEDEEETEEVGNLLVYSFVCSSCVVKVQKTLALYIPHKDIFTFWYTIRLAGQWMERQRARAGGCPTKYVGAFELWCFEGQGICWVQELVGGGYQGLCGNHSNQNNRRRR